MPNRTALLLIAVFLGFYALWAGSAVSTVSPTVDERLHAAGGWWARFHADFRVNREDPPLFLYLASIPLAPDDLRIVRPDFWSGGAMGSAADMEITREVDPVGFVHKARRPFYLIALAFGALLSAFAWHVAATLHPGTQSGPVAGVAAAAAFALEPLLLGHGPLVKNDVAFALTVLLTTWSLWRFTTTGSLPALAALLLSAAAAMTIKFSGLLILGAVIPAMLLYRALTPAPWTVARIPLPTRPRRLAAAGGVYLLVLLTTYLAVWASYQFRFEPSPGPFRFDMPGLVHRTARLAVVAEQAARAPGTDPVIDDAAVAAYQPTAFVRTVLFAHRNKLLPESMTAGLLFTYASTLVRPTFLMGEYSEVGWRYYFPLAYAFKTPLTTLALVVAAGLFLAARPRRWADYAFLLIPAAILFLAICNSRLNIGLRHFSPMYPFLLTGIALLVAHVWRVTPRRVHLPASLALLLLLAIEVVPHRLSYIQFFNVAAGGPLGGFKLLSDSNLDWGQDLHRLIAWQRENPHERLYIIYFGPTDLAAAGLRAINAPGSWAPGPQLSPTPGSVLAISASHLQGTHYLQALRREVTAWQRLTPLAVPGGTIYLFRVPPTPPTPAEPLP